ncbi:MAG: efflux RND transporter permease subunit [Thiohalomonadales bacterium]
MNIAEYFIKNKVISWVLTLIFLIGGIISYNGLGRLEDPEFTVKDAAIITLYPGASAQQVEEELTYLLENSIQELPYVDYIRSISSQGLSQITVTMKRVYGPDQLPQIWDELRRKINDLTPRLPPGVSSPIVNDDFGDVYGLMYAVIADGYSYKEMSDYVDYLKRELVLIDGVAKIAIAGTQQEQVFVEISRAKLTNLGISSKRIFELLATQNVVSEAGAVKAGSEYIRFHPTGEFQDVKELEGLIISDYGAKELIFLGDVAEVYRGFQEVPNHINSVNGHRALTLGVSFASGYNVVDVGRLVRARLDELEYLRPVGIEMELIYDQPGVVEESVQDFIINLAEAIAIVIVVLLIFMGVRSGILIGLILLLTVLGTLLVMNIYAINLQRISLGALIIALGMLVDNAIVVVEGILIGMQRGLSKVQASVAIVRQTIWPLLGATVIAVTAFAPIGLSDDSSGEFLGSLFYVLLISLMLSWFTAISLTPFFADLLFKEKIKDGKTNGSSVDHTAKDPYQGAFFTVYRSLLNFCMKYRFATVVVLIAVLVASLFGFKEVKQVFFPYMTTPMFYVDYWRTQGTDIRETYKDIHELELWLSKNDKVKTVSSTIGKGGIRFMLTYAPEKIYPSYGQLIVETTSSEDIDTVIELISEYTSQYYPQAKVNFKKLALGGQVTAKIEARFMGADPDVLRKLSVQAKGILAADVATVAVRDDWRDRSKLVRPQFSEQRARLVGVSKQDLDSLLLYSYSGIQAGLYRDGTTLMPIIARAPASERLAIDSMRNLQVWSPVNKAYVPVEQVVSEFRVEWEDALIARRDRKRTITAMADANLLMDDTVAEIFARVRPKIEAIPIPSGYALEWGGEYESQNIARGALMGSLPLGILVMFMITVLLFNTLKQPLAIWSTVPLAIVGVTVGLLILDKPFTFTALLGLISLSGMLIKNGIVLVDQINSELKDGKEAYQAVFDSAVSRVRPVSMAAITTILGMIPLLSDVFFESMAAAIMFGLGFATVLTLVVVPLVYCLLYNIKYRPLSEIY